MPSTPSVADAGPEDRDDQTPMDHREVATAGDARVRRMPRWVTDPVAAACAMMFALMLWGTSVTPLFSNSDEMFHLAAIFTTTDGDGWPASLSDLREEQVPRSLVLLNRQWDGDYTTGSAPGERGGDDDLEACRVAPADCTSTFTLREWATGDSVVKSRELQHPPLYYSATGAAFTVLTGIVPPLFDLEAGQAMWLLRVLTMLAVVPVPWIAARLARVVGLPRPGQVMAAITTLAVPGMVYTGPANLGPDAWLVLLSSVVILLAVQLDADGPRRNLVVFGTAMGVNAFTKSPGLAVNLAAVLAAFPALVAGGLRPAVRRFALVGLPAVAAGAWWWIRNMLVLGQFQPLLNEVDDPEPVGLTPGLVASSTLEWGEKSLRAFWGLFLVGNNGARPTGFWILTGLLLAAVIGAVAVVRHRRFQALAVISLATTVLMVWSTMLARLSSLGVVRAMQGRYLYPLLHRAQ